MELGARCLRHGCHFFYGACQVAYVSKAELIEQAKTLGATDEEIKGLTREEVDALIDTLATDPATEVEESVEESPAQPEEDATPAEDAESGSDEPEAVAGDRGNESPEPTDAGDSEPVEDSEPVGELEETQAEEVSDGEADGTGETELEAVAEVAEESAEADASDDGQSVVVEESAADEPDANDAGDAGDEPESDATELEVDGDADATEQDSTEAGTLEAEELTSEGDAVLDEDSPSSVTAEPDETRDSEEVPLLAREVKSSDFRDAMPTVFELADAALGAVNYELADAVVAEIACEVVRACGKKRAVESSVVAGVLIPFSQAGKLRYNTLRSVAHGMLGSFERKNIVNGVVVAVEDVCRASNPATVWEAVKEVRAYIGEPVDEPTAKSEETPASEPVEESAQGLEAETGDVSEDA